jgi:cell division protein FtsW (lipid II flippase)
MGNVALKLALVVSVIVAVLTGYVMLYFSGPRSYAPFWIEALPWVLIVAAPIAIFLRNKRRWWALFAIAVQLSLLAYLSFFPLVFAWTSSNPWRFNP